MSVTVRMSNNKKKAARKVFMVRTNKLSAFQMNRIGTIMTPRSIRRNNVRFSLKLFLIASTAKGARCKVHSPRSKVHGKSFKS